MTNHRLFHKTILVGVSGSIAAYKAADLVSALRKKGAEVKVVMTSSALQFITPLTLQTLSRNPVHHDQFEATDRWKPLHIELAQEADLMVIAPATASIMGKLAQGISDDLLTTTVLASKAPLLLAPAMNTQMYRHPAVQKNKEILESRGVHLISPEEGELACGDEGEGKLASIGKIVTAIEEQLSRKEDLKGKKVLVTAGPTHEFMDPVRFIGNPSTGKMGFALAAACVQRGAEVTLVAGPSQLPTPSGVHRVDVTSALEMREKVLKHFTDSQIVIKSAAVSDYRPETVAPQKIKKGPDTLSFNLVKNPDILKELGEKKKGRILIGFAAESEEVAENGQKKLKEKNLDLLVANNVTQDGSGFGTDTNQVILIRKNKEAVKLPLMGKGILAHRLIDEILTLLPA